MNKIVNHIKGGMHFHTWFLLIDENPTVTEKDSVLYNAEIALQMIGLLGNGSVTLILECEWEVGIEKLPDYASKVGSASLASCLRRILSLMPKEAIDDLELRVAWMTRQARKSKRVMDLFNEFSSVIGYSDASAALCGYIIDNIEHFPEHKKMLMMYLKGDLSG